MVRALGLAGIRSAVVTDPQDVALLSRFARPAFRWDDFEERQEDLLEALIRFGAAQPSPPVLFYRQDAQLLMVSRHRERLARAFRFVVPEPELVEDLVDKARFRLLAERLDLPVPATRRIAIGAAAAPPELDLRFPIILKPLTRYKAWDAVGGTSKALRVETAAEFRELWPRLAAVGLDVLAQELIPGPETRIESYHVYVDRNGGIAGEFTGRKIRTYPEEYGHSTALTITDAPDVAALGRSLVERLEFRGVAKFDFKRDPEGRLHLLEVNPRFNLWHYLGAVAGVNLPALVQADLLGLPRPAVGRARAGACWCNIRQDRQAARAVGVPAARWAAWMLRCEAKSMVWYDPMPFVKGTMTRIAGRLGMRGRPADAADPASRAELDGKAAS